MKNSRLHSILLCLWSVVCPLSVHADYRTTANYSLCPSETLDIGGTTITSPGIYSIRYVATDGTDSIVDVVVSYMSNYLYKEHRDLLRGESIVWHGLYVDGSQPTYYDRYKTVDGCDSVYQLDVTTYTRQPQYFTADTVNVCRSAFPYMWKGTALLSPGTYYDIRQSVHGTDSIEALTVLALPTKETRETLYLCKGNSITLTGVGEVNTPGIYTVSYLSAAGCDSTHTYVVNYAPSYAFAEKRSVQSGEPLAWHGKVYYPTENVSYYDYYSTVAGCDSNYVLEVTVVHPTVDGYLIEERADICQGNGYLWRGKEYWQSGVYFDSLRTADNRQDSVYSLHLSVRPVFVTQQSLRFCEGGSVSFMGHTFTEGGIYRDTLLSVQGCDSVVEMIVRQDRSYRFSETKTIPDKQIPYLWHGQEITGTGQYYDYGQTEAGCDSVYELNITVAPTFLFTEEVSICRNELPYLWRGRSIGQAGIYTDPYVTTQGYDSVYRLELSVAPIYRILEQRSICEGEKIVVRGKVYTTSGAICDTLHSADGCDSIVTTILNVLEKFEKRDTILVSADQLPYTWRGQTITSSGTYRDDYLSAAGCDSSYICYIRVLPTYHFTAAAEVCANETPYIWHGQSLQQSGIYHDRLQTVDGMDSIYTLELTVWPAVSSEPRRINLCEGETVVINGKAYSESIIVYDTLQTIHGCDSVVSVIINVQERFVQQDTVVLTEQQLPYLWHGQSITATGTYRDEHRTVAGCDSVYVRFVRVLPTYRYITKAAICATEAPFVWRGGNYSSSGVYHSEYKSVDGQDSIYQLNLTVHPVEYHTEHISLCDGSAFQFKGQEYTSDTVIRDTILSYTGCDSVVEYIVQFHAPYYYRDTLVASSSQLPIAWHGQSLSTSGTYEASYKTVYGCDSIYSLFLTVHPSYVIRKDTAICESEAPYVWRGRAYYNTGVYSEPYQTDQQYDSIYQLYLTVNPISREIHHFELCPGGSVHVNGRIFTHDGVYTDTIRTVAGCDSLVTYVVTESPVYKVSDTLHISDQEVRTWRGQYIRQSGIYTDTYTTVSGCDSIYELVAYVHPTYLFETDTMLCRTEESFTWRGHTYSRSGATVFEDKYQTTMGYDSIYRLHVTFYPTYHYTQNLSLCKGAGVWYGGVEYTAPVTFEDTLISMYGCDSIIRVVIQYAPHFFSSDTVHISDRQTIHWHGQTINRSGTYLDKHENVWGCDSTYERVVYVHPTYLFVTDTTLCQSAEPFVWRGKTYSRSSSTTIEEKYSTVWGYDSIYRLNVTFYPTYNKQVQLFLCDGASVSYQGKTYTQTGTYADTLLTVNGCDSITTVVVNMAHNFFASDTVHISDKDTIVWHGQTLYRSGTYLDSYNTDYGCDSTYERVVYVHPTYLFETDTMVCQSAEPLMWRGKAYSRSGQRVIDEKYTTVWGYDSIYRLHFDTYPQYRYTQQLNICEGTSAWFGGKEYSATGTYIDSLLTVNGCDSIITVVVNMAHNFFSSDTVHISNRDTIWWHGQMITKTGVYVDMHQTADGCDSTYQRYVVVHPTYIFQTDTAICQNEAPFHWRGKDYDQLGTFTYEDAFLTNEGYDSIYRLNLTVYPVYTFDHHIQLCEGQYEIFHGTKYTEAGEYVDTLRSSTGCDSICYVHVNILDSYYSEDHISINDNQSYTWSKNGQTYTEPGVYELYEKTVSGCDSIMRLFLTRNPSYLFEESAVICEPDTLPYFVWRGHEYNQSGRYYDSLQTVVGQDSVYQLDLTIHPRSFTAIYKDICENETFIFNGREITESGVYSDTLTTVFGCDSVLQLSINFNKYEITRFDTICDGDTVMWYGEARTEEGFYPVRHPNENGCDSIFNLNLTLLYNFHRNYSDTICEEKLLHNEPYLFGPNRRPLWGKWNATTRHYEDSVYWNCDNTNTFRLVVLPERRMVDTVAICEGDSVWFQRHDGSYIWAYQSGNYYDTIPSPGTDDIYSCDSIVCHHVDVKPVSRDSLVRHISDKDSLFFGNRWLFTSGIYRDTVPMAHGGCDSITVLNLVVDTTYYFLDSIRICQPHYYGPNDPRNTPYIWEGHQKAGRLPYEIYNPGVYWDSLLTAQTRVDSIYCLCVDVYPTYFIRQAINICEGDSVRFGEGWVSKKGTYLDTLVSAYGCDSIIQLTVNTLPTYYTPQTAHISDKGQYIWALRDHTGAYDKTLTVGGVYRDTLRSVLDCDSIIELNLYVHPTYYIQDSVAVCQSELPYIWEGHMDNKWLYNAGVYYDSLQTKAGYDSVYCLTLTVLPAYKQRLVFSTCSGDSIQYNNKVYTQPGTYYDTLHTVDLCDSILVIDYRWRDKYFVHKQAQTADNIPYVWTEGGISKHLSVSGVYYDTLQAVTGCDSVICLTLTVYPTYYYVEQETLCEGELPFEWHNKQLYATGIYYDSLQTVQHYDSIYCLHLTVLDTAHSMITLSVCEGEILYYNGKEYSRGGMYYDTLTCHNGCDSIIALRVQVQPRYYFPQVAQTADNVPYLWRGKTYRNTGVYYDSLTSVTGCDSIYSLTLTVYPTYYYVEQETLCAGELPFKWHNKQLYATGTYYDSLQTVQHYDSIYCLHLTVKDTAHTAVYISLCYGEQITINDKVYTKAGTYIDTLSTYDGCDSIVSRHIHVLPRYFFSDTVTTTSRAPYMWHGKELTHTGVYYDSLQTQISGCDSIYKLVLTVNPAYIIRDTIVYLCENDLPFRWNGHTYNESKLFEDTITINGVDSIYRVNLIVYPNTDSHVSITLCEGETYRYNGRDYSANTPSGLYVDTLRNMAGCDSIIYVSFRYFQVQTVSNTVNISDQQTYVWEGHNKVLTSAGIYYDTIRSDSGCDSIRYELTLRVHPTYRRDTTITICREDAPLVFGNRTYDSTGVYVDTMQTMMRYDSIWTIRLTINEMEREFIEKRLCQGEVFQYHTLTISRDTFFYDTISTGVGCGKITSVDIRYRYPRIISLEAQTSTAVPYIWAVDTATYTLRYSGTYNHIVPTRDGLCDSIIYTLSLSVYPIYDYRDSLSVCQSDLPYVWHGKMLYEAGVYYDSLQTVHGYDSVYTLKILSILPSYYQEQAVNLCPGGIFYYRGKAYTENGIFYDTIPSLSGCDSVFKITVRVFPSYERTDTVHVADGEGYSFNGRWLTKQGIYHDYQKTVAGCDSIQHLYLFVHPSYHFNDSADICDRDTFYWHNLRLTETGIYYDSLLTTEGYDSIYRLALHVYPTYFQEEYHEICPGRVTYIHGINITEPGVYMDTMLSSHGCDSVFKIIVNQTRSYRQTYTSEICQGDSIYFDGAWRRTTGDYYRTLGCDSIIQMHLVVHEKTISEKRVVLSDEELPYIYRGQEYTQTGIYADTLYSSFGCDSIVRLNLLVTPYVSAWDQLPLCPGHPLRIGADTITKAGLYTFVRRSGSTGLLDSLYRVEVYDAPAFDLPAETIHTCQGDTVFYGGRTITRAGHYDFPLKTVDGCDSLLHLDLYIHPVYQFYEDATIVDYEPYLWRGSYYDQAGNYSYTLPTVNDCDSTYTLRLNVIPTNRVSLEDTICVGSEYVWRGRSLTDPGFYTDTVRNIASLTSIIYSLNLNVVAPTYITSASVEDVCANQEFFRVRFTYTGATPNTYNIYFDQAALNEGFEDIYNHPFGANMAVEVPLPQKTNIVYNQHTGYVRPDYYTLRLVLDNGACGLAKSDTLSMLVKYPNWIIEQNWSDVVAPLKAEYNGGYQFGLYDWYVNGQRQQSNGTSYLHSPQLRAGDEVVLYATRAGESYAIPTCPLTIVAPFGDTYETPVMVYPTAAPKHHPAIKHKASVAGYYRIFSSTGHFSGEGEFTNGEIEITLPYVEGCYIIQSTTAEGNTYVNKVVVY